MEIKCLLESPSLPPDHKIHKILKSICETTPANPRSYYWEAECFLLNNSELYNNFSTKEQQEVLSKISHSLLEEAYFIEKAGIAYSAKMVALSETIEERQMYSHFSHEEASHLEMIRPFITRPLSHEGNGFLALLTNLIESGDKQCLTYFIQIVLEGLGLHHYQALRVGCLEPTLTHVLNKILADEAQHYRSGLALYAPNSLTIEQKAWIADATQRFEDHVNKGPIRVIKAVMEVNDGLHILEFNRFLQDIHAKEQAEQGLKLLNSLLIQ